MKEKYKLVELHNGFFNGLVEINGCEFNFQCCCEDDKTPDWDSDDAGITWGLCGDANSKLYEYLGNDWGKVINLVKAGWKIFNEEER